MQIVDAQDLSHVVREERRRRGWSQDELARRVGMGRQWINALESGGHERAQLGAVLRLLHELGLRVDIDTTPATRSSLDEHLERYQAPS